MKFLRKPFFGYALFWSWNLIFFILLVSIEVQTGGLTALIKNTVVGFTPLHFGLYALLLIAIPLGSLVLAGTIFRGKPVRLVQYFYGVEVPLGLLVLFRIFLFRELTPGVHYLYLLGFVGMLSYFTEIVIPKENRPQWLVFGQKIGHSILLLVGVYLMAIMLFNLPPILSEFVDEMRYFTLKEMAREGFFVFVIMIFFLLTGTLFVLLPVALLWLYFRAFGRAWKWKFPSGELLQLATIVLNLGLFVFLVQPKMDVFKELDRDFSKNENKEWFDTHQKEVKATLLDKFLVEYRYLDDDDQTHMMHQYKKLGFSLKYSIRVQKAYNLLVSPFLFHGNQYEDPEKAQVLYNQFFDGSIKEQEAPTIKRAMAASWEIEKAEAGILSIGDEEVQILSQSIVTSEQDGVASVEIHEVYENQTYARQEIFYYFELPENAAITGLWLSDDSEQPKKFPFVVSPRGAAQEVYKATVRRRIDPSLLEQVGPNQYRLRAFPIEPKSRKFDNSRSYSVVKGPAFHLWFAFDVLVKDGQIPMPILNQKRNVFWNSKTQLSINDKEISKGDEWLPSAIPASSNTPFKTTSISIGDTKNVTISNLPKRDWSLDDNELVVLVDATYSMRAVQAALRKTLEKLSPKTPLLHGETLTTIGAFLDKLDSSQSMFFGNASDIDMLRKASSILPKGKDAVLYLTDKGGYHTADSADSSVVFDVPLLVWHLGGEKAPIYDDAFLETIQNSHGGVVNSLEEVVQYFYLKTNPEIIDIQGNKVYELSSKVVSETPAYAPLLTKVYINHSDIPTTRPDRIKALDIIHEMAKSKKVVTQFSSMIVLVTDVEKTALEAAEKREDRFDREVENEALPSVNGTPEPEEWILILIVATLLFVRYRRNGLAVWR